MVYFDDLKSILSHTLNYNVSLVIFLYKIRYHLMVWSYIYYVIIDIIDIFWIIKSRHVFCIHVRNIIFSSMTCLSWFSWIFILPCHSFSFWSTKMFTNEFETSNKYSNSHTFMKNNFQTITLDIYESSRYFLFLLYTRLFYMPVLPFSIKYCIACVCILINQVILNMQLFYNDWSSCLKIIFGNRYSKSEW